MDLRESIDHLLRLSDEELRDAHAAELEDAVQRGLAAVYSGELWICHVQRELDAARGVDPERAAALELEIERSRASVAEVRSNVGPLHQRAQDLGVGSPV